MEGEARAPYVVPRYRAQGDTAFFHFLHGTVPGHQIDFMYCPEVPQGPLAQTHFGHLARLMKYIEPREGAPYAFALGNLSRDDVQHEPGHGGIAILFALRVAGVIDHAGRDMLPFAHGMVAVNRALDRATLTHTMIALHKRFLEREGAADRRADFYRAYVRLMEEQPEAVEGFLYGTIQELDDLPKPEKSKLGFDFTAEEKPRSIVILHRDDEPFGTLAQCAASLVAALYRSDIKWTSVTSGREIDIVGGTTIRLVPQSEAPHDGRAIVFEIGEIPDEEDRMMALLFGAKRRHAGSAPRRKGWREKQAEQRTGLRSEPPPGMSSSGDSQDSFDDPDVDIEIDDAAATIALPMVDVERELGPTSTGTHGARMPSSPPRGPSARSTEAHVTQRTDAAPFDPRRSSPVGGVAAVTFDARRSSPVGGVPAVSTGVFDARRSSPTTGLAAPALPLPSSVAPPSTRATAPSAPFVPPYAMDALAPASYPYPADTGLRVARDNRERKGRWIIAAAAFAAIAVIVLVAVTTGISLSEAPSGSGAPPEETSASAIPSAIAPAPPVSSSPPATTVTTTASATSAPPPKNPSKGKRK